MARPERPLDPSLGPIATFAMQLRKLRTEAGSPKYLQMARRTGRSRTALAEAAGGDHLPTWETVEAYVSACGADPIHWLPAWEEAKEAARRTPQNAPDPDPAPPTGDPPVVPPAAERRRPLVALFAAGLLVGALGVVALTGSVANSPAAVQQVLLPRAGGEPAAVGFTHFAAFVQGDLATSGPGGAVNVWDSGKARLLRRIDTLDSRVSALAFDPLDPDVLVTAGPNGLVRVWETTTGRSLLSHAFPGPGKPVVLAFDLLVRGMLAMGGSNGVVVIWDAHNDRPIQRIETGLSTITALSFDPHSENALAIGGPTGAGVWNAPTGAPIRPMHDVSGPVTALAFDPLTRNTLAIATPSRLGIWDTVEGRSVRVMSSSAGVTSPRTDDHWPAATTPATPSSGPSTTGDTSRTVLFRWLLPACRFRARWIRRMRAGPDASECHLMVFCRPPRHHQVTSRRSAPAGEPATTPRASGPARISALPALPRAG